MIRSMLPLAAALAASSFLTGASAATAPAVSISSPAAQSGPVTQEATGRGASAAEARKEAIVAALRQIVGEYVEADVQLADDEVVKNEILSFSNAGGVKSEQVGEPRMVGDEVEITMRVTVEPKPLVARVKGAAKAGARLDGPALAAEIAAAKDDYEAKKRVLEKAFANLPDAFMTIRIVDSEGKDTTGIDRELVTVDKKTGEATITIPVVLGFDLAVWKNNVYPALDEVLTAAAKRKIVDGLIVDRGKAFEGASTALNTVPYTGTRTITAPRSRPGDWQKTNSVALLRENLGRGRQLNFDLYEFDADELPLTRERQLTVRARVLRVRLFDAAGDAIDGRDVVLSTDGRIDRQWEVPGSWIYGIYKQWSNSFVPFAQVSQHKWQNAQPQRTVIVAPLWMPNENLVVWNQFPGMPECAVAILFRLPTEDLELIERIEVELIGPGGTN